MIEILVAAFVFADPTSPLDLAQREIAGLDGAARQVRIDVVPDRRREAFRIEVQDGSPRIVASDQVGAMYGAFEYAEQIRRRGRAVATTKEPFLAERGLNLFLTLPWNLKANDTDTDPGALTDPARWWFHDDDYWRSLFDLMARSRLNWLDIHGTWDISVTDAPNLYAYFVTSPSFPKVGVPEAIKEANLRQLNRVVGLAHAHGIRVSLMAYQAGFKIPQNPNPPYEASEANVYTYTREVVEQMIRRNPGLDAIGFRIGESGKGESFFNCYLEAVKRSGREIPLITRSWITRRQKVLPLAVKSKDFTVQIKYNGEQWAAPYQIAGGRMADWYSYSFEDYLSDAGVRRPARLWPGHVDESGERWPSNPYKIVWQVRSNGTHRIFPFYNPDWVRRSIRSMKVGTTSGYTVEGLDAYYPKDPLYYLANSDDKAFRWVHERDRMYWTTWGRLGYDPTTPNEVFDEEVSREFGPGGGTLAGVWKIASLIVPQALLARAIGSDHRDHAPELENGGDIDAFIQGDPLDAFVFRPIREEVAYRALGLDDGRISLMEVQYRLREWAKSIDDGLAKIDPSSIPPGARTKYKELATSLRMLRNLAIYYASRFRAAYTLATLERLTGSRASTTLLVNDFEAAVAAWQSLADEPYYRPFTERLRMRTNTFHWRDQLRPLIDEAARIKALPSSSDPPLPAPAKSVVESELLKWKSIDGFVEAWVPEEGVEAAWLLHKPLPSSTFFHRIPMRRDPREERWFTRIPRERWGHCLAFEMKIQGEVLRFPWQAEETPYRIVPSRPGPTPPIYSTEEAMTYLDPRVLDPEKHGTILLAPRAWKFFRFFDKGAKRKLLDPVARGMRLIVLQQDYVSGRYPLDWLPPIRTRNHPEPNVFDPGDALGLARVVAPGILGQSFVAGAGWEVFGSGGVARLKHGKGEVWLIQARLIQNLTYPTAASALRTILESNGRARPVVLVDAGTEGAAYTTALVPDLLNALGIPFLTLGEVIAKEQGMNSLAPVTGESDDDVLKGRGRESANRFLRSQVQGLARRPVPANVAAFEKERSRRRTELMRGLGLDPLPARTPLNPRLTGIIQRTGYRIEKVVFESRPSFFVTAHVYVPEGSSQPQRRPVIVHVNGHWAYKKGQDRVQHRAAFSALRGYLAIAIDSPGHSFEGDRPIERRAEGDHNDWNLFLGTNATGIYVWDIIRGLDYLATRPDADMTRVGITGASGGGLATLYAFAADDRFEVAIPVVYAASLEDAPDNGCLCNHVPGTVQVGDRSDILAIQAPKPVLVMGAEDDPEFPPGATRKTYAKLRREYALLGAADAVDCQVFSGGHDYSRPMRERAMGFFDRHLRGVGSGSAIPEPPIELFEPEDRTTLVLPSLPTGERTMRDIVREYLDRSKVVPNAETAIRLNGGIPQRTPLSYAEFGSGSHRVVTFESEPGLVTPGILQLPASVPMTVEIVVDDRGKPSQTPAASGNRAVLYLDILGVGELAGVEMRYPMVLGRSVPFIAGWQLVRAAEAMRRYAKKVAILAHGPLSSLAAMYAGLVEPGFATIEATGAMRSWSEAEVPALVQPRAHLFGPLEGYYRLVWGGRFRP